MPLLKLPPIMTCHLTSAHTLESLQESRDGRLRNESAVLQTLLSALSIVLEPSKVQRNLPSGLSTLVRLDLWSSNRPPTI